MYWQSTSLVTKSSFSSISGHLLKSKHVSKVWLNENHLQDCWVTWHRDQHSKIDIEDIDDKGSIWIKQFELFNFYRFYKFDDNTSHIPDTLHVWKVVYPKEGKIKLKIKHNWLAVMAISIYKHQYFEFLRCFINGFCRCQINRNVIDCYITFFQCSLHSIESNMKNKHCKITRSAHYSRTHDDNFWFFSKLKKKWNELWRA